MNQYNINEIFYSLQGEGYWAGRPAVFIRFSGCNLRCPFCDTDHKSFTTFPLPQLIETVSQYLSRFVVLTGGEPSLYVDKTLVDALHKQGFYIAIETNGTHPLPPGIDWVTLSPKDMFVDNAAVVLPKADELKLVFDGNNIPQIEKYATFPSAHYYLQPCDTGQPTLNDLILRQTTKYILSHPQWSLSLQMHKIIGVR